MDAWVEDLEAVVDAAGLERFSLLGLSNGGAVAIAYSVRHPERVSHLVLCGSFAQGRLRRDPSSRARAEAEALLSLIRVGWGQVEVFRRNGLAVLLYDHRNFGGSDGEPRQQINPWTQCRGYLDAIDFVQTLGGIDHDRIALWGDSYSGGQVLVAGAVDERMTAIVAQTPVCGSEPPAVEPSWATFDAIRDTLLGGEIAGGPDVTVGPLPVVSADQLGTPSLLEPVQAFRWFIEYGARHGSAWINRVTRVVPDTPVPYSPVLCAPFVAPPTLMMVAPEDEMTHANYGVARLAYDLMPEPRQWYDIDGGHFGLLHHPGPLFDEATGVQTEFLQRCL